MNKTDISNVLSLSCVENYFLGYFQKMFDIRSLYSESFVSFNEVLEAFMSGAATYENYPLERLQTTSGKLGLTSHILRKELRLSENSLNLVRVNQKFFDNSKILPWREDHYIAIENTTAGYFYVNNYPLSEGKINAGRLCEIYGDACLSFRFENSFDAQKYRELCDLQYKKIAEQSVQKLEISEEGITRFQGALLVLKTLRKRVAVWLAFEADNKRFDGDLSFQIQTDKLIQCYDRLIVEVQLQIVRKKSDIGKINEKILQLCVQERLWGKAIQKRRG